MYEINKDVIFVPGAKRGAIYNFNTSKVYSINDTACDKLNKYINDDDRDPYLEMLKKEQLIDYDFAPRIFAPVPNYDIQIEMAWLEITQKCNLKCLHCYEGNEHIGAEITLSLEQWKKAIDELVKLKIKRLIIIGGEPCCNKDLIEIIQHATQYTVDITLFTNGTCFTEQLFNCVIKNNVRVKLSIYGHNAEVHDSITQVKGSFDRMTSTVKTLIENSVRVSSAVIIMKENQNYVNEIMDFVNKIGAKCSKYDVVREVYGGTQNRHLVTRDDVLSKVSFKKPNFKTTKEDFLKNLSKNTCLYGKITIMENGNVIPCEFDREFVYGNVLEAPIVEILHNEKTKSKWFMDFSQVKECCDCEFRFCCHDCRPLGFSVCGKYDTKNPRCFYNVYEGKWM